MTSHVEVSHCNSIEKATFTLTTGALNMKYGPNGIGKSTIARALRLHAEQAGDLEELRPFKHRVGTGHPTPRVTGAGAVARVMVFDDAYVAQFAFQQDEVLKDSFEVFINTADYRQGMDEINNEFGDLKLALDAQPGFEEAIAGLTELRQAFPVTKAGALSRKSRGLRGLAVGGRLDAVPEELAGYRGFVSGGNPAAWAAWHSGGQTFLGESDHCPYCAAPEVDKATVLRVGEAYDAASVKNMTALRDVIDRLGAYFEPRHLESLREITSLLETPTQEQESFLVGLHRQVTTFLDKLQALRAVSFHTFDGSEVEEVEEALRRLRIDLSLLPGLDSETIRTVVSSIDDKLDAVAERVGQVKGGVGKQRTRVKKLIETNQEAINQFLDSAGYRYRVRIEKQSNSYRMILEHQDAPGHVESAGGHLSYGERNAFALVLFMHQVLHERPDLVILDDPVSSFDKTKKFAILHELFNGRGSIKDFTTLLLTHDLEPAIDVVRAVAAQFQGADAVVHFLSGKDGVVTEKQITAADIKTFHNVCVDNIAAASDDVIRCIYLRRLLEAGGDRGDAYDLLSSLLHLRTAPSRPGPGRDEFTSLSEAEVASATAVVEAHIPGFDYARVLADAGDPETLRATFHATTVGYEKVQLYRVFLEATGRRAEGTAALTKFVNESFHIENEYVMQLDPRDFDTVPNFVVAACSDLIDRPSGSDGAQAP